MSRIVKTCYRFDSDRLTAKKAVNGNLVIYNNVEGGDMSYLSAEDVQEFAEWLRDVFGPKSDDLKVEWDKDYDRQNQQGRGQL